MQKIRIDGPYRVEYIDGEYYVIGHDNIINVRSQEEGNKIANLLRKEEEKNHGREREKI